MDTTNRRAMSAALQTPELPPEAWALIREGTPRPQREKPVRVESIPRADSGATPVEPSDDSTEVETSKPVRARSTPAREVEPLPPAGLAHLSVRLPAEIPQALLRASLDRKLKRQKPWTQQDIVAEALGQWFKRNGGPTTAG